MDAGDDDGGVVHVEGTLAIDPPMTEVTVENGAPATVTYTATLALPDGTHQDVTADTRFQIDPMVGSFATNRLTVTAAAKTKVVAAYADKAAFGDLTARIHTVRVDPALPSGAPALFDHPDDAALAPQIVYPPAGTVMPRNLGDFEIHWTDGHSQDVFEVSLHTELSDVKVYVPGGNGDAMTGPHPSWSAFSSAEWLAAVGAAGQVTFRVRGAVTTAPGAVGGGPARTAQLSNEIMDGGLYYWANATSVGDPIPLGIFRHDMKKPGQPVEQYITTTQTAGRCVACHVLSRDGKKMAITFQDPDPANPPSGLLPPGPATTVDVETKAITPQTQRWNFATFTPDDAQLLSVDQGKLVVRDAQTQQILTTMTVDPPTLRVTHPDLSPDGKQLLYVRIVAPDSDFQFSNGKIFRRSYDAASHTFGPEIPLVTDAGNNFYPTWSPDGAWVLFNRTTGGTSYDNNNAAPWVIKADGTMPPVLLGNATIALSTDSWPRWAPFPQTLGDAKQPMFWITMSSKRDFGVRRKNTGLPQRGSTGKRAQIWMTPFFPAQAALGEDPSAPAFRLPFQSLASSNHIAQWTERVVDVIQ